MSILAVVFGVIAGAAWLSALVHTFWSLAHLSGRRSLGAMLLRGYEWFNMENFTPRGVELQKRLWLSAAAIALSVVAAAVVARL